MASSYARESNLGNQQPPGRLSVGIINLGCSRNLVDSQIIGGRLRNSGHSIVDAAGADTVIVNTCSFIKEAREESVDVILELIDLKKQGKIRKIVIAGCLSQRYGAQLTEEFKDIDAVVGVLPLSRDTIQPQVALTAPHSVYLKICESCVNACSFCIIPRIKGSFSSRSRESIMQEVAQLEQRGARELTIIGQDTTAYGLDIYKEKRLASLLREIASATTNIQWIRLLYTFPSHVTDELIEVIADEPKICRYIDLPLQHINDTLLKRMNRTVTKRATIALIEKIRQRIPGVHIRTTCIVGFPGETDAAFEELIDFVKTMQFERLGVFAYSPEEGTPAYHFDGQVSDAVKQKRRDILMREQQKISASVQRRLCGTTLMVLIDEKQKGEDDIYIGRSEYDALEIDGTVTVRSRKTLHPGDFVEVMITDSTEYDLTAEAI